MTEITRVPAKQCKACNIGTLRELADKQFQCDWCSIKVAAEDAVAEPAICIKSTK